MAVTGLPRCRQCDRFHKARSQLRFPKMGGWGWRAGNVEVVLERPVSGRQADRRNDRDWATAERRLSGATLKIANVATWW